MHCSRPAHFWVWDLCKTFHLKMPLWWIKKSFYLKFRIQELESRRRNRVICSRCLVNWSKRKGLTKVAVELDLQYANILLMPWVERLSCLLLKAWVPPSFSQSTLMWERKDSINLTPTIVSSDKRTWMSRLWM